MQARRSLPRDVDSSFFRNAVLAKADFEIMLLSMLNRILDPALRFLFRRSLPSIDGVFKAEELEHPEDASIERDGYGIPPWGCSPQRYRSVLLGDHVRLCDLYNDNVGRAFGGIFQESVCAHRKQMLSLAPPESNPNSEVQRSVEDLDISLRR